MRATWPCIIIHLLMLTDAVRMHAECTTSSNHAMILVTSGAAVHAPVLWVGVALSVRPGAANVIMINTLQRVTARRRATSQMWTYWGEEAQGGAAAAAAAP